MIGGENRREYIPSLTLERLSAEHSELLAMYIQLGYSEKCVAFPT